MTVEIRPIQPHEHDAARKLLLANGWSGPRFEPQPFEAMLTGSHTALVAVDGEQVVAFARSVADGVSNGYICTLVVAETHRKRGLARALVTRLMGDDPDQTWVLRAERPGLFPFYEKLGFRRSAVTMERVRAGRGASSGSE